MADKSLTDFLGAWSGQVKALIENSSQSNYMSKSDFDSAVSAFGASQSSSSFTFSWYSFSPSYAPYNLYKLADDYIISLLPVDGDKYDYTDASKKIQLAEMAYKLTNGQLTESTNKIEPTLTCTDLNFNTSGGVGGGVPGIDNYNGWEGYSEFQISYDGDGMLACKTTSSPDDCWAYIDENNKMSVAVDDYVSGTVYIKAYEGHTYKAKVITIGYITMD